MRQFTFNSEIILPRPREEIFEFFSDAGNLELLTPPWLNFHVLTPQPITMDAGTMIDYRLRVHGIPLRWRSEITVWEPPFRFADEQRRGPYRQWIHEHRFEEYSDATKAIDHVRYAVWGGAVINRLFVRRDVEKIFAFRTEQLRRQFGDRTTRTAGG